MEASGGERTIAYKCGICAVEPNIDEGIRSQQKYRVQRCHTVVWRPEAAAITVNNIPRAKALRLL